MHVQESTCQIVYAFANLNTSNYYMEVALRESSENKLHFINAPPPKRCVCVCIFDVLLKPYTYMSAC